MVSFTFILGDGTTSNQTIGVLAIAMYLGFFPVGTGPGSWLIPSEVFSTTIRAKAMSLATFSNHTVATLVTSTFFLSLANLISYAALFAVLGVVCLLILMFFHIYLPETKGKSH